MSIAKRPLFLVSTLLFVACLALGCRTEPTGEPDTAEKSEPVWADFGAPDGSFTVLLPGVPRREESKVSDQIMLNSMRSQLGNTSLTVSWSDYDQQALNQMEPWSLLGSLVFSTASIVGADTATASALQLGKHPGVEVRAFGATRDGPAELHGRIFLIGNRLYQLLVTGPRGKATEQVASRLFASFELKNESPELESTPLEPRTHPDLGARIIWPAAPESVHDFLQTQSTRAQPAPLAVEHNGVRYVLMGVPLAPLQATSPGQLARRILLDIAGGPPSLRSSSTARDQSLFRSTWAISTTEKSGLARVTIRPGMAVAWVATWPADSKTPEEVVRTIHSASFPSDHHQNLRVWQPWSPDDDAQSVVLFPGKPELEEPSEDQPFRTATLTPVWPPVELSASIRALAEDESPEDFVASTEDTIAAQNGQTVFWNSPDNGDSAVLDTLQYSPDGKLVRMRVAAANGKAAILYARMSSPSHYGEVVEHFMRSLRLGPGPLWSVQRFPSLRTAVRFPASASIEVLSDGARLSSSVKRITGVLEVRSDREEARSGVAPDGEATRHRGMQAIRETNLNEEPATGTLTVWSGDAKLSLEAETDPDLANPHLTELLDSLTQIDTSPAWQHGPDGERWIRVAPLGYPFAVDMPAAPAIERDAKPGGREVFSAILSDERGLKLSVQASWVPPDQTGQAVVDEVSAALEKQLGATDTMTAIKKGNAHGRAMEWSSEGTTSTVVAMSDGAAWFLLRASRPADSPELDAQVAHFLATFTVD